MMRQLQPPFRFDLRDIVNRARSGLRGRVGSVTLNLPFVSIGVNPSDPEREIARELVIRMADRRVLNSFECCDGCIDEALASLQEIRDDLLAAEVRLVNLKAGALYLVLNLMQQAVRQFLTFEQQIAGATATEPARRTADARERYLENRELYFAGLETLRGHLHRCLIQVAKIGDLEIPRIAEHMRYTEQWQLEAYESPASKELEPGKKDG